MHKISIFSIQSNMLASAGQIYHILHIYLYLSLLSVEILTVICDNQGLHIIFVSLPDYGTGLL